MIRSSLTADKLQSSDFLGQKVLFLRLWFRCHLAGTGACSTSAEITPVC